MQENMMLIAYTLIAVNIIGFIIVGIDKYKARRKLWRIPERVFFGFAIAGGSIGIYVGLLVFKHKTRYWYFMYGIPSILAIEVALAWYILGLW